MVVIRMRDSWDQGKHFTPKAWNLIAGGNAPGKCVDTLPTLKGSHKENHLSLD